MLIPSLTHVSIASRPSTSQAALFSLIALLSAPLNLNLASFITTLLLTVTVNKRTRTRINVSVSSDEPPNQPKSTGNKAARPSSTTTFPTTSRVPARLSLHFPSHKTTDHALGFPLVQLRKHNQTVYGTGHPRPYPVPPTLTVPSLLLQSHHASDPPGPPAILVRLPPPRHCLRSLCSALFVPITTNFSRPGLFLSQATASRPSLQPTPST
ncbi:hypothetical protein CCHR01_15454 [Colletotrichum chrysophilum]|uniref:Uncharacterized protein n=1 Tax=Colletotrichum chrysophilum TaxID=1836956 RepID=A0AAD9EBE1_9PEZI|nr:hypothetical protein CCHR01_15454 [Colletotrichum chrysophilum]